MGKQGLMSKQSIKIWKQILMEFIVGMKKN